MFEKSDFGKLKPHLLANPIRIDKDSHITRGPVVRLIKSQICKNVLFDSNLKLSEDIEWNIRLVAKCEKICIVKQVWYIYKTNYKSKTHGYNKDVLPEFEKALNNISNHLDFTNSSEYFSFCDMLIIDLKIIADTFLLNDKFDCSDNEKRKIINDIYTKKPWVYLNDREYFKYANTKRKIVCILFRLKILFGVMKLLGY
jgi:hypothetical protein